MHHLSDTLNFLISKILPIAPPLRQFQLFTIQNPSYCTTSQTLSTFYYPKSFLLHHLSYNLNFLLSKILPIAPPLRLSQLFTIQNPSYCTTSQTLSTFYYPKSFLLHHLSDTQLFTIQNPSYCTTSQTLSTFYYPKSFLLHHLSDTLNFLLSKILPIAPPLRHSQLFTIQNPSYCTTSQTLSTFYYPKSFLLHHLSDTLNFLLSKILPIAPPLRHSQLFTIQNPSYCTTSQTLSTFYYPKSFLLHHLSDTQLFTIQNPSYCTTSQTLSTFYYPKSFLLHHLSDTLNFLLSKILPIAPPLRHSQLFTIQNPSYCTTSQTLSTFYYPKSFLLHHLSDTLNFLLSKILPIAPPLRHSQLFTIQNPSYCTTSQTLSTFYYPKSFLLHHLSDTLNFLLSKILPIAPPLRHSQLFTIQNPSYCTTSQTLSTFYYPKSFLLHHLSDTLNFLLSKILPIAPPLRQFQLFTIQNPSYCTTSQTLSTFYYPKSFLLHHLSDTLNFLLSKILPIAPPLRHSQLFTIQNPSYCTTSQTLSTFYYPKSFLLHHLSDTLNFLLSKILPIAPPLRQFQLFTIQNPSYCTTSQTISTFYYPKSFLLHHLSDTLNFLLSKILPIAPPLRHSQLFTIQNPSYCTTSQTLSTFYYPKSFLLHHLSDTLNFLLSKILPIAPPLRHSQLFTIQNPSYCTTSQTLSTFYYPKSFLLHHLSDTLNFLLSKILPIAPPLRHFQLFTIQNPSYCTTSQTLSTFYYPKSFLLHHLSDTLNFLLSKILPIAPPLRHSQLFTIQNPSYCTTSQTLSTFYYPKSFLLHHLSDTLNFLLSKILPIAPPLRHSQLFTIQNPSYCTTSQTLSTFYYPKSFLLHHLSDTLNFLLSKILPIAPPLRHSQLFTIQNPSYCTTSQTLSTFYYPKSFLLHHLSDTLNFLLSKILPIAPPLRHSQLFTIQNPSYCTTSQTLSTFYYPKSFLLHHLSDTLNFLLSKILPIAPPLRHSQLFTIQNPSYCTTSQTLSTFYYPKSFLLHHLSDTLNFLLSKILPIAPPLRHSQLFTIQNPSYCTTSQTLSTFYYPKSFLLHHLSDTLNFLLSKILPIAPPLRHSQLFTIQNPSYCTTSQTLSTFYYPKSFLLHHLSDTLNFLLSKILPIAPPLRHSTFYYPKSFLLHHLSDTLNFLLSKILPIAPPLRHSQLFTIQNPSYCTTSQTLNFLLSKILPIAPPLRHSQLFTIQNPSYCTTSQTLSTFYYPKSFLLHHLSDTLNFLLSKILPIAPPLRHSQLFTIQNPSYCTTSQTLSTFYYPKSFLLHHLSDTLNFLLSKILPIAPPLRHSQLFTIQNPSYCTTSQTLNFLLSKILPIAPPLRHSQLFTIQNPSYCTTSQTLSTFYYPKSFLLHHLSDTLNFLLSKILPIAPPLRHSQLFTIQNPSYCTTSQTLSTFYYPKSFLLHHLSDTLNFLLSKILPIAPPLRHSQLFTIQNPSYCTTSQTLSTFYNFLLSKIQNPSYCTTSQTLSTFYYPKSFLLHHLSDTLNFLLSKILPIAPPLRHSQLFTIQNPSYCTTSQTLSTFYYPKSFLLHHLSDTLNFLLSKILPIAPPNLFIIFLFIQLH